MIVSYADLIVVAALQCFKTFPDGSLYQHVLDMEPAYETLYDAAKEWVERGDH